jgi:hypothetical protein
MSTNLIFTQNNNKSFENKTIIFPLYTHILECEQQLLFETQFVVQSTETSSISFLWKQALKNLPNGLQQDFCIKLLEDVGILFYQLVRSKSKMDYTIALINYVKLRSDGPVFSSSLLSQLTSYFHTVFDTLDLQSVEDVFSTAHAYLSKFDEIKHAPIF